MNKNNKKNKLLGDKRFDEIGLRYIFWGSVMGNLIK